METISPNSLSGLTDFMRADQFLTIALDFIE